MGKWLAGAAWHITTKRARATRKMEERLHALTADARSLHALRKAVCATLEAQADSAVALGECAFERAMRLGLPLVGLKMLVVLCEASRVAPDALAGKAALLVESLAHTRFARHAARCFDRVPRDAAVKASLNSPSATRAALAHIARTCPAGSAETALVLRALAHAAFESDSDDDMATAFALVPCVAAASPEQFESIVAVPCARALKLRTERTLPVALKMATKLAHATSEDVLVGPALKAIKTSSKDGVQMEAAELLGVAFSRWRGAEVRKAVVDQVLGALAAETAPSRRLALVHALGCMRASSLRDAANAHGNDDDDAAERAVVARALYKRVAEEKSDEGRSAALDALARWAPFPAGVLASEPPAAVLSTLAGLRFCRVAPLKDWPGAQAQLVKLAADGKDDAKALFALDALASLNTPLGVVGGGDASSLVHKHIGDASRHAALLRVLRKLDSPNVALLLVQRGGGGGGGDTRTEAKRAVAELKRPADCLNALAKAGRFDARLARFALDAVLGAHPPANAVAPALAAAYRLGGRRAWEFAARRFHAHDVKRHALDGVDALLAEARLPALEAACQASSEHVVPLDKLSGLIARLQPLAPLSDRELAAWGAPPGLVSTAAKPVADDDDDAETGVEEGKVRLMKQGRKGRGGARKDVYSAETEEWERKVRLEQLEKARREQSKAGPPPVDLDAFKKEEEMRARLRAVQRDYAQACDVLATVCRASSRSGAALASTLLPLAAQGRAHPLSAVSASALVDAVLLACLNNDAAHARALYPLRRALFEGTAPLVDVRASCEDSGPLSRELWAFVQPIALSVLRESEDKDALQAAAVLVSMHAGWCVEPARLEFLNMLLRVASPQCARAVEDLFTAGAPPTDTERSVLAGDLGLLHAASHVRRAALASLALRPDATLLVWFARSDADEPTRAMADALFGSRALRLPDDVATPLLPLLSHASAQVRAQAARALVLALDEQPPEGVGSALDRLFALYAAHLPARKKTKASDEVKPKFVVRESDLAAGEASAAMGADANTCLRLGVCQVLEATTNDESAILDQATARRAVEFVLEHGTRDDDAGARDAFLACGVALLKTYSEDLGQEIFPVIQGFVDGRSAKLAAEPALADAQKQGAIVLLGAAANSLDAADERVPECIRALVAALKTPSEKVQRAVAQCLPGLVKAPSVVADSGPLVLGLLEKALAGKSFGERRGAAMGLACVVKGLGLASLKQHQVVTKLVAEADAAQWERREGALLCVEELCQALGRLFEPYLVQTLEPVLLKAFSDASSEVRDAAHDASKLVMANLSGPGVSMVLPKLLGGIQSDQWRTKHAAISMLGAVAFCAPKQLGSSLPQVVPRLIDAFSDTHLKVRQAAMAAMRDVSSVIKNPEIETLAPVLLSALTDPNEHTRIAVDELFKTRVVNAIDAPSLALLVPILLRGLKERSTETKKHSALIIGNMLSMVGDAKAVKPYLEELLPVLKAVLFDPIPGVRGTAARAIGTLTRGLGPEGIPGFGELLAFLVDGSRAGSSSVERQGGAQGLVEVLVALGSPRLDEGLESEVFARVRDTDARAREGALWALVFLPAALDRARMLPLLSRALGCALEALGDDAEPVRDAAHRAGRVYVTQFAESDPRAVMPALEKGLVSPAWRVRQSAVRLVGDVVGKLVKGGGASATAHELAAQGMHSGEEPPEDEGDLASSASEDAEDAGDNNNNNNDDDDETPGGGGGGESEGPADAAMLKTFGAERRDVLIARMYLLRSDPSGPVRQTALFVWKAIVSNTPRTLRRIVRPLMQCIIQGLSDASEERQQVAGKTLGDIVRKLGERVLGQIVPVVVQGLEAGKPEERRGVALGLQEMVASASRKDLEPHAKALLEALLRALCDDVLDVRESAGRSFARMHSALGGDEALVRVVGPLVRMLEMAEQRDAAVLGLQQAIAARQKDVMAFLLPRLMARPLSTGRAAALAMACECVAAHGDHFVRPVIRPLVSELAASGGASASPLGAVATRVVRALGQEERGLSSLVPELVDLVAGSGDDAALRCAGLALIGALFASERNGAPLDLHVPSVLKTVVRLFAEQDTAVLQQAVSTLAAVLRSAGAERASAHIDYVRNSIRTVASMDKHRAQAGRKDDAYALPAFALPGALDALLEVYMYALANGTNEAKESGAQGMGELVDLSSAAALKPYVVKMAGPLIRVVGDRLPAPVKAAILDALRKLLVKGGAVLKPFLPQLQTTFVKSLSNSVDSVRAMGIAALEEMVPLLPRVDLLVSEFVQGMAGAPEPGVRADLLHALLFVLVTRGKDVTALGKVTEAGSPVAAAVADCDDAAVRVAAAACEAAALALSGGEFVQARLRKAEEEGADWPTRHGALLSLNACLRCGCRVAEDCAPVLAHALEDESASVRAVAADACGWAGRADLLSDVAANDDSAGVRALAAKATSAKPTPALPALLSMPKELGGVF